MYTAPLTNETWALGVSAVGAGAGYRPSAIDVPVELDGGVTVASVSAPWACPGRS